MDSITESFAAKVFFNSYLTVGIMKKTHLALAFALVVPQFAFAGAATGGATEFTQYANHVQLLTAYAKQVNQYIMQGLQYKTQLQNLIDNPFSLLGKDIGGLMNGVGELMSAGSAIGSSMANIDKNFALKFKNPLAGNLAQKFTTWHETNTSTLEGALKSVGLHRDQFKTDAAAITALYNSASQVQGQLAATKVVAEISAQQMVQLQTLQDLISTQNLAASTYMATQTAKDQAAVDAVTMLTTPDNTPRQKIGTTNPIKWNSVLFGK